MSAQTCLYEVSIDVDIELADAYRSWLAEHAREMLALPGFLAVSLWEVEGEADRPRASFVACYRLTDRAALTAYLQGPAQTMRAAGLSRFGDGFNARRRILQPLADPRGTALSTGPVEQDAASGRAGNAPLHTSDRLDK